MEWKAKWIKPTWETGSEVPLFAREFRIAKLLTAAVLFVPPLATLFGLVALPGWLYLAGLGLALVCIPVTELTKALGLHKG